MKAVHIFQNKNGNPRSQAVIEFENKEDRKRALERKLKYFNYTIKWEYTLPYRKDKGNIITSHIVTTRRPLVTQYNWAPNERLNNKEKIDQKRHRLEELAQRLVEEIKEKLIWKLSNSTKIGAGSMAKKDKGKETRVMESVLEERRRL
ncbi:40753_t:CDS:2, partial [Gigaspora margarita]